MMLESYSESSLHLNHTDNTTVSDKTLIGSILCHCSRKKKKVREREEKHATKAQREREAKDKPEQLLSSWSWVNGGEKGI